MQTISLERQLARIIRDEEQAWERASTIRRPVEQTVIMMLDDGKKMPWEYDIAPERRHFSYEYFSQRLEGRCCEKCHKRKPFTDFKRVKYTWDGWAFRCKRCQGEHDKITWSDAAAWRKVA